MFSANQMLSSAHKDNCFNAESTRHFVGNLATCDLRHAVVPSGEDEFERAGLEKKEAKLVSVPVV